MAGLITDSHFVERDRMGRLLAFLARLVKDGRANEVRAIAVDRETALLVDPDGEAHVIANASHPTPFVYFLHTPGPPEQCAPGRPLAYRNIPVYRLGPQGSFNLPRWSGNGGVEYLLTAEDGGVRRSGPGEAVYY